MSSSYASSYKYQKPSTIATRSLVSGTKPAETVSTSSYDSDAHDRPVLQRKTTDHYQQAVADAASKPVEAAAAAADPSADTAPQAKPALDRQQSWKHSDVKRGHMEKILGDRPVRQGYTSTSS